MKNVEFLTDYRQIEILADFRRLAILRRLMAAPATLTQIGAAIGQHPAWVRHHIKRLEQAGLVEIDEVRVRAGAVEKFYRSRASALLLQQLVLPDTSARPTVLFAGSHDLAVELLVDRLSDKMSLLTFPVGSLDGLTALRQGLCHLCGAHLLDPGGEYNAPFVRHFFPDREILLITLAHREQGLMLAPGNAKHIRSLLDLVRPDVSFVNRQRGSGTRLWLDRRLHDLGLSTDQISGYGREVRTHTACASLVALGEADAALGLHAAAMQHGLDFLPLFQERYDLIVPQEQSAGVLPLLDALATGAFRREVSQLVGYDTAHTGEGIPM